MGLLAEAETAKRYNIIDETLEHSPFPMFWCTDIAFVMANDSFCTLTGRTKEELKTLSFNDLIPEGSKQLLLNEIFDDTQNRDYKIVTREIVATDKKPVSFELRITRLYLSNGEKYYFGLLRPLFNLNTDGDIFKEQQQLLYLALGAAQQGIWVWNASTNERSFSTFAYEILGYPVQESPMKRHEVQELLHPDDLETTIELWNNFLDSDESYYEAEFRMQKSTGEYIWLKSVGRVIDRDNEGKPMRIGGIIADINEKKLTELLIKEQTQKLLNYAFFNSHQLRAPLSSIMGLTELLKTEYNPEFVTLLDKVVNQLDNAVHEINNLLWDRNGNETYSAITGGLKRVTLIDGSQHLNIIYKKTFEKYTNAFDAKAYTAAETALNLLLAGQLETDYILLDADDAKIDIWQFLNKYEKQPRCKPIYLLTSNIDLANVFKASEFGCIAGFLIKPIGKQDIVNLIAKLNN